MLMPAADHVVEWNQGESRSNRDAELIRRIDSQTFHQVRDLHIVRDSGRVIVHGRSPSYYVKQLVTHAALGLLPGQTIENVIDVTR